MDKLGKLTCSEDFVEYRLFVDSQEYGDLNDLIQKLFIHINPLTAAHIWQNEPFNLQIYPETSESVLFYSLSFNSFSNKRIIHLNKVI